MITKTYAKWLGVKNSENKKNLPDEWQHGCVSPT